MTDNELIAEFMGFIPEKSSLGETWRHPDKMGVYGGVGMIFKYDTSWDWLMPVVEKIRKTGYSNEVHFGISDTYSTNGVPKWSVSIGANITRWNKDENGKEIVPMVSYKLSMKTKWWHSEENLLQAVYKAVVEFIKWYNTQNSGSVQNKLGEVS